MNELEINLALAKATGWDKKDMRVREGYLELNTLWHGYKTWMVFQYWRPTVIWPIAAKYDYFPARDGCGQWLSGKYPYDVADTPELAVAMAVINGAKKC